MTTCILSSEYTHKLFWMEKRADNTFSREPGGFMQLVNIYFKKTSITSFSRSRWD